ncbi:pyridoxamine 5'-phosphate oxidase family protein [Marinagarivorans cellulosilyticus]|uniref:Pyridoxamine 5'-phosphate oxidase N-terminal domain-containing protein n=1 Tax=Marinagarivorans cellulosilyticus TaxID=2721545 RepID=A0AAN1WIH1_9GAMM|nr:pyridoxamine 5'-phosphate oxidase family protein [Marinagarivorans cellulosilyticus]BCD98201.1 hypothetical protein MARGE09_P2402 [Marinagarivorans cellulosilyticus]
MEDNIISSHAELRKLYGEPLGLAVDKERSELDEYSRAFLALSPFAILSTASSVGIQDCSPRGDQPGFIQIIDHKTLALPDRPGNNRLDSLSNIIENPNVGLLVLVPGFGECLRINGSAKISIDTQLLEQCKQQGKLPKSAITISITEIYFHCTKAIKRSKLWQPESLTERSILPSFARILMAQIDPNTPESEVKKVEAFVAERAKNQLY